MHSSKVTLHLKKKLFTYLEGIIKHDLPDIDIVVDKDFKPRTQRPLHAPPIQSVRTDSDIDNWKSLFLNEVKICGEILQRHTCRAVCHKYGNSDTCRFQFPHEIVQSSWFDHETNSIYLKCLDSNINYYNPFILVYCCHNHDLKCILSGKAAKAAMFYITDYITKQDLKTYEVLSLLLKAVLCATESDSGKLTKEQAKMLLHKCLSQFGRQQQIHA
jgi:hypothetical protein